MPISMNADIATKAAEAKRDDKEEAACAVCPVLSFYVTSEHGRVSEVCHRHSVA
jgi:hypothetical protein